MESNTRRIGRRIGFRHQEDETENKFGQFITLGGDGGTGKTQVIQAIMKLAND